MQTPRSVNFLGDVLPEFPAPVELIAQLGPAELFGEAPPSGQLGVVPLGCEVTMSLDTFHGGIILKSKGILPKPTVSTSFFDMDLKMNGCIACITGRVSHDWLFKHLIRMAAEYLPAFLCNALQAPVEVVALSGNVGGVTFTVKARGTFDKAFVVIDVDAEIAGFMELVQKLPEDGGTTRVLAAQKYLNEARWLEYVATHPNQFAGERLLNVCKAIEALFGSSVDGLRKELAKLKVKANVVEYLAAVIHIRNQVDVGHAKLSHIELAESTDFHAFVGGAVEVLSWLIKHTIKEFVGERYTFHPIKGHANDVRRTMAKLSSLLKDVNPVDETDYLDV